MTTTIQSLADYILDPTIKGEFKQILGKFTTTLDEVNALHGKYPVVGTSASQKIARGVAAVTTSLEVTTGLASVVAAGATLKDDPNISAQYCTVAASTTAGNILVKTWMPTATNNVTIAAATKTNVAVSWWAIGT
jgi:hypothetical protein